MRRFFVSPVLWVTLLGVFLVVMVPLGIGVWLPDVFLAKKHQLGEITSEDGHHFHVIQYWNGYDFYTTELIMTRPDGSIRGHVLDGDDSKHWRAWFELDEEKRSIRVRLGKRHYDYQLDEL